MEQFQGIDGAIGIGPNEFCLMSRYSFVSQTPYRGHISLAQETHKLFLMCLLVADRESVATVANILGKRRATVRGLVSAVLDCDWDSSESSVDGIVPPVLIKDSRWTLCAWDAFSDSWELPASRQEIMTYETMSAAIEGRRSKLPSYLREAAVSAAVGLRLEKPPGLFYRLGPDGVQFGMVNYWVTISNERLTQAFRALMKQ